MVAELEQISAEVVLPEPKRIGRPTIRTEDNRKAILSLMAEDGLSFSRACETVGFTRQSGSEWKDADPDFLTAVTRAEGEFVRRCMADLRACRTKWDTPDPKALELMTRRLPEFRQHQETTSTSVNLNLTANLTPERLSDIQARHRASLERLK